MFVEYEDESFHKMLEEKYGYELLRKKAGKDLTKLIIKRKNQLQAALNFSDYLNTGLGKPHRVNEYANANYYGIRITANFRLICAPKCKDLSPKALKQCDTVILKGVDDYHGDKTNWLLP